MINSVTWMILAHHPPKIHSQPTHIQRQRTNNNHTSMTWWAVLLIVLFYRRHYKCVCRARLQEKLWYVFHFPYCKKLKETAKEGDGDSNLINQKLMLSVFKSCNSKEIKFHLKVEKCSSVTLALLDSLQTTLKKLVKRVNVYENTRKSAKLVKHKR